MRPGDRANPDIPIKIFGEVKCPLCDGQMILGAQDKQVVAKHKAPICDRYKRMRTEDFAKLLRETYDVDPNG